MASTRCVRPTAPSSSSPTTSACSNYIVPDTVHVLYKGQVIKSGDKSLALELEANGYADIIGEAA